MGDFLIELDIVFDENLKKYKIVSNNMTIAVGETVKSCLRNLINAPDFDELVSCL